MKEQAIAQTSTAEQLERETGAARRRISGIQSREFTTIAAVARTA